MAFVSLKQTHLFVTLESNKYCYWVGLSGEENQPVIFWGLCSQLTAGSWTPWPFYWVTVSANPWLLFPRYDVEKENGKGHLLNSYWPLCMKVRHLSSQTFHHALTQQVREFSCPTSSLSFLCQLSFIFQSCWLGIRLPDWKVGKAQMDLCDSP